MTYLQVDLSRNNVFYQTERQDSLCMRVLKLSALQPQHTFDSIPAICSSPHLNKGTQIERYETYSDSHTT